MRILIKLVFINLVSLFGVSFLFPGLTYGKDFKILFLAGFILTIINFLVKPIIKIFLLPINLITLGMFGWLAGVLCLFILTLIVPQIELRSFQFMGFATGGFVVPRFYFTPLLSLIAASFLLSFINNFLSWLLGK